MHAALRIALSSCQYPAGLLDARLSSAALRKMADMQRQLRPTILIIAGDQIYVDATAGLFDPERTDWMLETAYDEALRLRGALSGAGVDIHTMLDDHEIVDNWEPGTPVHSPALVTIAGVQAQGAGNGWQLHVQPEDPFDHARRVYAQKCRVFGSGKHTNYSVGDPLWYRHVDPATGHRFFFCDTRTTRSPRDSTTRTSAHIICEEQWTELGKWMDEADGESVSFVVSPSILLPRRLAVVRDILCAIRSDAWDGYPSSLHGVLAKLCELGKRRFVFLSGDEHISCVAKIEVWRHDAPERRTVVHSIHTSALYAPYPFANGRPENFTQIEQFEFSVSDKQGKPIRYACQVEAEFPTVVNGFTTIVVESDGKQLQLGADFHDAVKGSAPVSWRTAI